MYRVPVASDHQSRSDVSQTRPHKLPAVGVALVALNEALPARLVCVSSAGQCQAFPA